MVRGAGRHNAPIAGPVESLVPVFVVGMPRSGTTWVAQILSSPPAIGRIDESYLFSHGGGLGALMARVGPERRGTDGPAGLGRLMSRSELLEDLRPLAQRWLARELPPGGRFVVEKSPWHLRNTRLIAELLPSARFVHVLRDGRDAATSLLAARRSWAPTDNPRAARSVSDIASLWAEAVRLAREAEQVLGERFLEVRFEALKEDPEVAIAQLYASVGIDHDQALVRRVAYETAFERRHTGGEKRFYRAGRVGDWRRSLSLRDAHAFQRAAGPELLKAAYEQNPRWWLRQPLRRKRS